MQIRMQSTMGMSVPFEVPSTVEEFGAAGGVAPEAAEAFVLKYALDEGMFRTTLPAFREAFFKRLGEETGVERRVVSTNQKKQGDELVEVPVYEKDSAYWKYVLSETDTEEDDWAKLAAEVAAGIPMDLTSKPRSGKPGKQFITKAEGLASAVAAGRGTWSNIVAKLQSLNPGLRLDVAEGEAPDTEVLAAALKVDADRRAREQADELL